MLFSRSFPRWALGAPASIKVVFPVCGGSHCILLDAPSFPNLSAIHFLRFFQLSTPAIRICNAILEVQMRSSVLCFSLPTGDRNLEVLAPQSKVVPTFREKSSFLETLVHALTFFLKQILILTLFNFPFPSGIAVWFSSAVPESCIPLIFAFLRASS